MKKKFNITGICIPSLHYMVDTSDRIDDIIDKYIEQNEYFTINRARQYGKSTTLELLYSKLKEEYIVMDISFEAADDCFASAFTLAQGLANKFKRALSMYRIPDELKIIWNKPISKDLPLDDLSERITDFCTMSEKEIILMVDEVDKAADNHIFLSFLGLLREKYLRRAVGRDKTFKSVILAGVHDIKNLKMKMQPEQSHNYNSPWNIAAEFNVDLSFSVKDIAKMLYVYESEHETGMDIEQIAGLLYEYTSGYPYLVSYLCKKIDEDLSCSPQFASLQSVWSKEGVLEAVRLLVKGPNTLYDDMIKHVSEYEDLYNMLHNILFKGETYQYHEYDPAVSIGKMFGFIQENDGQVAVANRIFETQLYSYFIVEELQKSSKQRESLPDRNQFIKNGNLDMDLVMKKYLEYYTSLYDRNDEKFIESYGRKLFLMFLKPIINGTGNFYVEDQSRNKNRTDVIIDYRGLQYIVEIKIWHGEEYNKKGELQLLRYLEAYGQKKGYLLSYNFNKNKEAGVREEMIGDKQIFEVVV